jgi:MFS family permease
VRGRTLPDMTPDAPELARVQRRTVRVLMASQVLGGVGIASGLAVGGLLAAEVSGSTALSGLAVTATVLGAGVAALPLARVMSADGRRRGLAAGWTVGTVGAGLMVAAAVADSFLVLLVGAVLFGAATTANLQARYAATDCAEPARRGRALAVVVWATTVGAVLGPNLTGPGATVARAFGLPELAGPFVFSAVGFGVAAAVVTLLLRPDPLLTARAALGAAYVPAPHPRLRASLAVVGRSPDAVLGLAAVVVGHAVMVGVMSMTPVHMHDGGAHLRVVGLVISVHIAGMYALSPLVGALADRLGRVPVIVLGQGVLLTAVAVAGIGSASTSALGAGLFLLGLGWSCSLVAGSTLLSESVELSGRPGVQGASDFLMNVGAALGGAASGVLLGALGYGGLTAVAAVLTVPVLLLTLARRRGGAGRGGAGRGGAGRGGAGQEGAGRGGAGSPAAANLPGSRSR